MGPIGPIGPYTTQRFTVMKLVAVGCSYRNTPIALRERMAFDGPKLPAALDEISARYGCEVVVLSTCNRVELYLARGDDHVVPDAELVAEFLSEAHKLPCADVRPLLYERAGPDAVLH